MKSRRKLRRSNLPQEIAVTTLVDVALCLLIVFILISESAQGGVNVDLPTAEAKALSTDQDFVVVSIDQSGRTFVGDTATTPAVDVAAALQQESKGNMALPIYVRADRATPYGIVVGSLALMREAGYKEVSLVSENEP